MLNWLNRLHIVHSESNKILRTILTKLFYKRLKYSIWTYIYFCKSRDFIIAVSLLVSLTILNTHVVTTCYVNKSEETDSKGTIHTCWILHQCLVVIHLVSKLNAASKRRINCFAIRFCLKLVKINQSSHIMHIYTSLGQKISATAHMTLWPSRGGIGPVSR